jgi:hypothetical protein
MDTKEILDTFGFYWRRSGILHELAPPVLERFARQKNAVNIRQRTSSSSQSLPCFLSRWVLLFGAVTASSIKGLFMVSGADTSP